MAISEDDRLEFEATKQVDAKELAADSALQSDTWDIYRRLCAHNYEYLWSWMGVPIIQTPADIMATQEAIWTGRPQLIIETGVARGGSVVFYASLLELLGEGRVLGVDIDIRAHNMDTLDNHPMRKRIDLIVGSSIAEDVISEVRRRAAGLERVMVILDSNHTHEHVLAELQAYAPLVTPGQHLIVADTSVEYMTPLESRPRPWSKGDNPKTALDAYLSTTDRFERDASLNNKLVFSSSPGGYLRCVKA
jgi:Cephalosporin hydroxylase